MDEVVKYEACLNLHGSKEELGANNVEMLAPVMTWMSIHFLLVVVI